MLLRIFFFLTIFFFLFKHIACRISVSWWEMEPRSPQWKHQVLTTGPPGNSLKGLNYICKDPIHRFWVEISLGEGAPFSPLHSPHLWEGGLTRADKTPEAPWANHTHKGRGFAVRSLLSGGSSEAWLPSTASLSDEGVANPTRLLKFEMWPVQMELWCSAQHMPESKDFT